MPTGSRDPAPPCSEGVLRVILAEPLALSAAELAAFVSLHRHNYRPVQPLGERVLLRG